MIAATREDDAGHPRLVHEIPLDQAVLSVWVQLNPEPGAVEDDVVRDLHALTRPNVEAVISAHRRVQPAVVNAIVVDHGPSGDAVIEISDLDAASTLAFIS